MTIKAIASTEAQNNFGRILTDVILNNTRYVVKRRNLPQVIILSLADFEQLLASQNEQHKIINIIRDLMPVYELGEIVNEVE
jgi:PHD/YefM family antitoxin component YafN of YafNO toxin-antitoxin module